MGQAVYTACNITHFMLLHTLYASLYAVKSEQLPIGSVCRELCWQHSYINKNTEYSPNIFTESYIK